MAKFEWRMFKIDQAIQEVLDIQEDNNLPDADVKDMLEMLKMDKEKLYEDIGLEYKNLDAHGNAIKDEIHALKARLDEVEDRKQKIKDALTAWLDGEKFETPKLKVSFRRSEETVIDDFELLPDDYIRIKYEPDKTAIKKAIKDGEAVEGAHIEKKKSCVIK